MSCNGGGAALAPGGRGSSLGPPPPTGGLDCHDCAALRRHITAVAMKKKKKGQRRRAIKDLSQEEAREELLALQYIFGEDLVVHEDRLGFTLSIVPHPGEAQANHVAVTLVAR